MRIPATYVVGICRINVKDFVSAAIEVSQTSFIAYFIGKALVVVQKNHSSLHEDCNLKPPKYIDAEKAGPLLRQPG